MNVTGELIGEDRSPKFRWGVGGGGGWIVCQDVVFFFWIQVGMVKIG